MKNSCQRVGRRRFIKALPTAVAAGVALPKLAAQQQKNTPLRFGKETIKCAEQVDGLQFTDAEEEMMLRNVNRNLENYEALRKIDIPLDTEPAIQFKPFLPGKEPKGRSTPGMRLNHASRPVVVDIGTSPESIAFEPVTTLSALVAGRRITSTDLTKMYLAQ
jgi:hypothetical protein